MPDADPIVGATANAMARLKELAAEARRRWDASNGPPAEATGTLVIDAGMIAQNVTLTLKFVGGPEMRFVGLDRGIVGGGGIKAQGYYMGQMPRPNDEWSFQINGGASGLVPVIGGYLQVDFNLLNPLEPQGTLFAVGSGSQASSMLNTGTGRWSKA